MRDEYDFAPGQGVRGKYYESYRQSILPGITVAGSPFVSITSTGLQYPVRGIATPASYPAHLPSPKLQVAFQEAHAGKDSSRG